MVEIRQNPDFYKTFCSIFTKYASSVVLSVLKRQLLSRPANNITPKHGAEVAEAMLVSIFGMFNNEASEAVGFTQFIHDICAVFAAEFSNGYHVGFNCKSSKLDHQCSLPESGCHVHFQASDACLLIRNTLITFFRNIPAAGSSVRKNSIQARAKSNRLNNRLNDTFGALREFLQKGGDAANNPLIVWSLL